jgi:rfaE bifunctional protein kinase chain/domain
MAGLRILVIGDLMLDRFVWGSVRRISPEAPVPVVQVDRESFVLGGAGNVARNLQALGGRPDLVGVIGRDRGGEDLRQLLDEQRLNGTGILEVELRPTTVKMRVIAQHQQVVRVDRESAEPLEEEVVHELGRRAAELLPGAHAVVVSDYEKGVISADLLRRILPIAHAAKIPICVDPKPANYHHYHPATVVTPNVEEACTMAGIRGRQTSDILQAGRQIQEQIECEAVLLTRGDQGMTLFQRSEGPVNIPASAREVFDVTGAGDTVVAVVSLALAAGAPLLEAAALANIAGGCAVGKLGTAPVFPEELERALGGLPSKNPSDSDL